MSARQKGCHFEPVWARLEPFSAHQGALSRRLGLRTYNILPFATRIIRPRPSFTIPHDCSRIETFPSFEMGPGPYFPQSCCPPLLRFLGGSSSACVTCVRGDGNMPLHIALVAIHQATCAFRQTRGLRSNFPAWKASSHRVRNLQHWWEQGQNTKCGPLKGNDKPALVSSPLPCSSRSARR